MNEIILTILSVIAGILFVIGAAILWLLADIKDELKQLNELKRNELRRNNQL